jgi:DNA-binding response OmpR family regulator
MKSRRVGSAGTVLVVDPDDALRRFVRNRLEAHDYLVLDAGEVAEAVRIARVFVGPIHLALVNLTLPATASRELAETLRASHAESQLIYMSTRAPAELVRKRELAAGQPFLRKPFTEEQLLARIREVLTEPP